MKYFIGHWAGTYGEKEEVEVPARLAQKILAAFPRAELCLVSPGPEWRMGISPDAYFIRGEAEAR